MLFPHVYLVLDSKELPLSACLFTKYLLSSYCILFFSTPYDFKRTKIESVVLNLGYESLWEFSSITLGPYGDSYLIGMRRGLGKYLILKVPQVILKGSTGGRPQKSLHDQPVPYCVFLISIFILCSLWLYRCSFE